MDHNVIGLNYSFILLKIKIIFFNRTDPDHHRKFAHPTKHRSTSNHFTHSTKERCRYGNNCNK